MAGLTLWTAQAGAQAPERATADEVKAAFLYNNFTTFVEWPAAVRSGEIVINVFGEEMRRMVAEVGPVVNDLR